VPSLIDIRRRIRAVKSTQQITKAMKMVSSSKLRRAQERILRSRPFAVQMERVFNSVASRTDPSRHPLLAERHEGKTLLVAITADRGLSGSFSANVVKAVLQYTRDHGLGRDGFALALVGRKGRDLLARRGFDVRYEEIGLFQNLKWSHAQAIAQTCIAEFTEGDVSSVHLVYNEFRSILTQRVVVERLLPIPRAREGDPNGTIDYLFEPAPEVLLGRLLPYHVAVQVMRALLESAAAEHAARMNAMENATRNAREMVDRLTLYMNKVRQASITREIIEVVSGAQSV
jgi:F-type H+-transporting ATPase subunit gamma